MYVPRVVVFSYIYNSLPYYIILYIIQYNVTMLMCKVYNYKFVYIYKLFETKSIHIYTLMWYPCLHTCTIHCNYARVLHFTSTSSVVLEYRTQTATMEYKMTCNAHTSTGHRRPQKCTGLAIHITFTKKCSTHCAGQQDICLICCKLQQFPLHLEQYLES